MLFSRRTWITVATSALLTVSVPTLAVADEGPTEEQQRLMKSRKSERYEVAFSGTSIKGGGARIHVAAPASVVRKAVTDYRNYSKMISRFEKAKVVGRNGNRTDLYLQVPILKGAAKIWVVLRFEPPRMKAGEEIIEAKMVKGNVKRMDAVWRIRRIDDQNTQLNLEMIIIPDMPAPASLITSESQYASHISVTSVRDHSEKKR